MFPWVLLSTFLLGIACETPIIQTPSGPVQGFTLTTYTGKEIDAYFGIPFAKPPVGPLRFQKPEPVEPWTEVLQATNLPLSCHRDKTLSMLDSPTSEEDCLYLIISVPKTKNEKIPVIVRIHGGGFIGGSVAAEWGNTTSLAGEENVIVVSMNYRLGIFGFLYLDTPGAPGNVGLWDQNLALKWIKENIESFGGDSDSITIIGESAGGASVNYHVLSEHSHPYFNRAIMESGMAGNPWAIVEPKISKKRGLHIVKKFNCKNSNLEEVVKCLQSVEPSKLMAEVANLKFDELLNFGFVPTVDGDFIKDHPRNLVEKGQFKKGEYMVGAASSEGLMFAQFHLAKGDFMKKTTLRKEDVDHFAESLSPNRNKMIKLLIKYLYSNWTDPDSIGNMWETADKIFGDYYFTCDVTYFSDAASQSGSTVYRHVFDEEIASIFDPSQKAAFHASQIGFIYGTILNKKNPFFAFTETNLEFSKRIMRTRANFARTGNPNISPDGSNSEHVWPPYTATSKEYILVTSDSDTIGYGYRDNFCSFWKDLLPKLQEGQSCSKK